MIESARTYSAIERRLILAFSTALLLRLLFPYFDSPLDHLFSDAQRHWDNGRDFLHPTIMGSSDPFMYQLWLFLLQQAAALFGAHMSAAIALGCGVLCALMPYGWYRALRELTPRSCALGSALVIALLPSFIGLYAYFMTETLLLALSGFAFWLTLRAQRKRNLGAFAGACALWWAAAFTRIVMLPMAILCLLWLWWPQQQRLAKALLALLLLAALSVPAGLHARARLGSFAPFGNLNLNAIYRQSGRKDIEVDYGPQGIFTFGSPSYYNPTFYPFSDWTTARRGTIAIRVDTRAGSRDWVREAQRIRAIRIEPLWHDYWENLLYLMFGQSWPDNDRNSVSGWLAVWTRWLWPPVIVYVALGAALCRFQGREWLLPICALAGFMLLAVQTEGIMEGRFRKPLDPIFVAALSLQLRARRSAAASTMPVPRCD